MVFGLKLRLFGSVISSSLPEVRPPGSCEKNLMMSPMTPKMAVTKMRFDPKIVLNVLVELWQRDNQMKMNLSYRDPTLRGRAKECDGS